MPDRSGLGDALLVEQAKQGDADAFGELHDRYALRVFRFVYGRVGNRQDAEDLTSEVFLRAWRSLHRYRSRGYPFSAYLFRIARNLLVDHYRRDKKCEQEVRQAGNGLRGMVSNLDDVMILKQEYDSLHAALEQMREDYRDVLLLRFVSGLSSEETAKVMGRSSGAVRVLQHRALKALRNQLGSDE